MADVKISALPLATTPLAGTEVLPIVQSATTDQVTVANLTAGRAVSASSLTLTTTPLAVGSGGTGFSSITSGYVPYATAANTLGATSGLQFDGSNLGLGVTPSAWGTFKAIDFQGGGAVGSYTVGPEIDITTNCFFNGTSWIYKTSNFAARYLSGAGQHQWFNAASGTAGAAISFTQAMTLDASGNLGIGETSPSAKLHVKSSNNAGLFRAATDTFACWLNVRNGTQQAVFGTEGSTGGSIASNTSAYATVINDVAGYGVQFATSNTLRATINSSGKLLVGATGDTFGGATNFSVIRGDYTSQYGFALATTQGSGNENYAQFVNGATSRGSIIWDTTASELRFSGKASGTYSDARLKTIKGKYSGGLDLTNRLSVYDINWKTSKQDDIVLVAQETISIAPHIVEVGKDGEIDLSNLEPEKVWRVDYSKLVPVLVSAIQELAAKVAELEAKI